MVRKINNIISFLFLLVFLLPTVVKLEHHHEHFKCHAVGEKHLHVSHEKCVICDFEFSVFLTETSYPDLFDEKPVEHFCNNYNSVDFSNLSKLTFLLRAPPVFTNSI